MIIFFVVCGTFVLVYYNQSSNEVILDNCVAEILRIEEITNCKIIKYPSYSDVEIFLEKPSVTENDINQYIEQMGKTPEELKNEYDKKNVSVNSYEAYIEDIKEEVLINKEINLIAEAREKVINKLMETAEFTMDSDVVANYAVDFVMSYEKEAQLYELSLKEYCSQVLRVPYEQLFDICYSDAERQIKKYLLIGAIAYREFGNDMVYENNDDIYKHFQELENQMFSLFIKAEEGF